MKFFYTLFFSISVINAFPQLFLLQWERTFRGHFQNAHFKIIGSATDLNNNFYFVGNKDTSISSKIFFFKYLPDGSLELYVEYFEPYPNNLQASTIITDPGGNIIVCGWRTRQQSTDLLMLKYDTLGNLIWQFSEPVTIDNNPDRLDVLITSDSAGAVYYAHYNADSVYHYKLKCGKVNSNGNQVWLQYLSKNYDKLLAFKIRSDNKLEIAIGSINQDSILVSLYDTSFGLLNSYGRSYVVSKAAFIDEFDNTYLAAGYFDIFWGYSDTTIIIKLDPDLNERWTFKQNAWNSKDQLSGKGQHLYLFNENGLSRIDTSGFVSWQSLYGNSTESAAVSNSGDAYVSYSYNTSSSVIAVIEKFDSSGTMTQSRSYLNYIYPISVLNNNSSIMTGMSQGCCGHNGNQVVYFDSTFTDSVFYTNLNYQHKIDINFNSLTDHQHNIINFSRLVDTVIHSGYYAFPGLGISKFDTSGTLLWRKNLIGSTYGIINYRCSSVDINNNAYIVGQTPIGGPPNYVDRIIKISSDGLNTYQYLFYDSALSGRYEITSIATDQNGNLFAAGTRDTSSNYASNAVLIKLDSTLQLIWIKYISIRPTAFEIAENLQFRNQNLAFNIHSVLSGVGMNYVCDYDTSGNQLLTMPVNSPFTPYRTLMKAEAAGYTLTGITIPPQWYVVRMDTTGSIICQWQDTSASLDWNNSVSDLIIDNTGNAYVIGNRSDGISGNYYLRKFHDCTTVWIDSISGYRGSNLSIADSLIYASGNSINSDFSPVTVYDTAGIILFRDSVPGFSGNPVSITSDLGAFFTSSSIRTDSGGVDIDIRRYIRSILTQTTGVKSDITLVVYPNPARNQIMIKSSMKKLSGIDIFNSASQLVFSKKFSNENYLISLPESMNGQYFYLIQDENKTIYSGKFIIVR
jgi:hypothetical protein